MLYTVIAYRWGWTNADRYQVAACLDADEAFELAQEECNDRGGKYGVAVYEWASSTDERRVAYYPSSYGEERPHMNQRIEMFRTIGQRIHEVATTHTKWGSDESGTGNVPTEVVPPDWVSRLVQEQEASQRFHTALQRDVQERHEAGAPALDPDESKQWVAHLTATSQQEAEAYMSQAPAQFREAQEAHAKRKAAKRAAG
jgi:hypothetical protein